MQLPFFEVRDRRQKEWFWLDNVLLDEYAKVIGPNATLVYIALSRHADNELQNCWPSMDTIAEKCGIKSRNTVAKGIKMLQTYNMIEVQESINPANGKRLNNVYTLLARHHWKLHVEVKKAVEPSAPERPVETAKIFQDELPAWLHPEIWDEWVTYRREIKKKLTASTIKQQIAFLEKHQADYKEIILASIQNGWTGLFPLKGNAKPAANKQPAPAGKYSNVGQKI